MEPAAEAVGTRPELLDCSVQLVDAVVELLHGSVQMLEIELWGLFIITMGATEAVVELLEVMTGLTAAVTELVEAANVEAAKESS